MNSLPIEPPPERPQRIATLTEVRKTGCGKAYITHSIDPEYPWEIFGVLGKPGACARALMEALTRVITVARRSGCPDAIIVKQLKGIRCPNDSAFLPSCPEAIAQSLEALAAEKEKETPNGQNDPE